MERFWIYCFCIFLSVCLVRSYVIPFVWFVVCESLHAGKKNYLSRQYNSLCRLCSISDFAFCSSCLYLHERETILKLHATAGVQIWLLQTPHLLSPHSFTENSELTFEVNFALVGCFLRFLVDFFGWSLWVFPQPGYSYWGFQKVLVNLLL